MVPTLKERNYRYACPDGHSSSFLGDQVPHWSDRFDYHGFGLDSDYQDCCYRTYGRSTN